MSLQMKTPVTFETQLIHYYLQIFLLSGGIFESPNYTYLEIFYSIFITLVAILQILGCCIGMVNVTEVQHRMEILIQSSAHIYFFSLHWIVKFHKKRLIACIEHLKGRGFGAISIEVANLTGILFKKIIATVLTVFISFLSLIAFTSFFIPFFGNFDLKDKYIYQMPFWFQCTDNGTNNFPVEFLCWKIETYFDYVMINSVQSFLFLCEVFVYITSFIFYTCVRAHIEAHQTTIKKKIINMNSDMEKYRDYNHALKEVKFLYNGKNNMKDYFLHTQELIVYEKLKDIVKYHQFIFRVSNNIMPVLCWIATASLCVVCSISTFSAFTFITEAESDKQGEFMFRMKIGSVIANATIMFFLYCNGAEVVMHVNENIGYTIYDSQWYCQSIKFRKLLNAFFIQLQKPFQVRAFGVYNMNFSFFMTVIRTTYSALNMLLMALTDKKY